MMMPANYSAVAENEMTYVVGGGLVDVLAPVMEEKNWQNINTNLINIVGNSFLNHRTLGLAASLKNVFDGNYVPGKNVEAWGGALKNVWTTNDTGSNEWGFAKALLNTGLQVVGGLAAVYTLGDSKIGYAGPKSFTL